MAVITHQGERYYVARIGVSEPVVFKSYWRPDTFGINADAMEACNQAGVVAGFQDWDELVIDGPYMFRWQARSFAKKIAATGVGPAIGVECAASKMPEESVGSVESADTAENVEFSESVEPAVTGKYAEYGFETDSSEESEEAGFEESSSGEFEEIDFGKTEELFLWPSFNEAIGDEAECAEEVEVADEVERDTRADTDDRFSEKVEAVVDESADKTVEAEEAGETVETEEAGLETVELEEPETEAGELVAEDESAESEPEESVKLKGARHRAV